ncbi:2-oxo acid dehydrogenase subunit E2 [Mycolicibacterium wolinskyi]|uniref:Dihydrolipoamide acetyltransferase component of pyruvate dehydrogenase complex n=1 Tax=Mycolicibacterium wolinskyi TaxID=59750 RepID=A0A1X2FG82_9MYCO|nr:MULTISPECIES: dihydrolipoamide acetyltransferase family protein [Mycolicibacterium]MCV7284354.1 2-oxo acid dehydrogenase subunit E2 [Mycolicibacterium wolinskyi]MCV7294190.1 2-oxo acid dehydrogenase subunit E2 [Mycolicibacterium goodii]ORX17451.1 branched-chain alpha-keto acid dehydrogenase subunit E2 [Mycolicibacterium wolinskyi]
MSSVQSFVLPDLGEGLTEAEIVTWFVSIGDTVDLNQIVAEVETAKASVELPSPYAGTVRALHAAEGETVAVGRPIIDIDTDDAAPEHQHQEKVAVLVGYGVAGEAVSRRGRRRQAEQVGAPSRPLSAGPQPPAPQQKMAKPPVRFLAKQNGVDLADIEGTGPKGEVTGGDVAAYLAAARDGQRHLIADASDGCESPPADEVHFGGVETRTPIKGVRKQTAAAMVASAFTAPHATEFVTVDVTASLELLERLRTHPAFAQTRLTPMVLIAKALLIALRSNPSLNSFWDEPAQEIVTKHYVNLGVAAATPRGLMVPNIKNADQMSLRELAAALNDLTGTARAGKTTPADLAKGTITITNVGVFGVDTGTPILNPDEAAILCVGAIRKRPWEHLGAIALRSVATLSLSFDHRLVDGEQGSRFLAEIGRILSDPFEMIALG